MFSVSHTSLNRCLTIDRSDLLSDSCLSKRRVVSQKLFPLITTEAFDVGDDLSYSVTVNTWGEQHMEEVTKESSPMMMTHTGNTSRLRWVGGW